MINLLLTMGLPAIDESLQELLTAMQSFPKALFFSQVLMWGKSIGLILALCAGANESYMMMLGRKGMDVLKLIRIIGFSMCITGSGIISNTLSLPGRSLETNARTLVNNMNKQVAMQEKAVAKLQAKYHDRLIAVQDSLDKAKMVQEIGEDASKFEKIIYSVANLGTTINNNIKRWAVASETKVSEWLNNGIRFVGELVFQMSYYGMFLAQRAFMAILSLFCPIAFALSLVGPWRNAWSQWISKFVSLSLWGFVIYVCIYYVDFILLYCLQKDITAYTALLGSVDNSWGQIGALGMQGIGSNCMYAMGMLVGAYIIRFVPEVSSWLIPGGVSSSIGSAAGGLALGAAIAGGKLAGKATVKAAVPAAKYGYKGAGATGAAIERLTKRAWSSAGKKN